MSHELPEGAVEITPEEWLELTARQQVKAERHWNRRRDWMAGAIGTLVGGVLGAGVGAIVRALA
jgi:hypothetical protein